MTSVERYNKIQMFEDLKQNINRENLHKAQLNNRYNEAEEGSQELEQSRNEPRKITEDDDDSLSGYEFEERQANYQKLIEDAVDKDGFQLVINRQFLTPQCGNKKLQNELQLANERLRIMQEMNLKEMQFLRENYQRKLQCVQIEKETLLINSSKVAREEGVNTGLRKENRALMELKEQVQERMADVEEQNNKLRRENDKLLVELHKKEEAEVDMIAAKMRLQAEEERLRQIVAAIEVEKQTATQRSRHSQQSVLQCKRENEQLKKIIHDLQNRCRETIEEKTTQLQRAVGKLQVANNALQRRNNILQESLIEHLTHTSQLILQKQRSLGDKTCINANTTLNLHEESPIKPPRPRPQTHRAVPEDPEVKRDCKECLIKTDKIRHIKQGLQAANSKIVELLVWKCQVKDRQQDCKRLKVNERCQCQLIPF